MLVAGMRLADKRLAGQTIIVDLIILIVISVLLEATVLRAGVLNALSFIVTVVGAHHLLAMMCARSIRIRRIVRSRPRPLIRNARVDYQALAREGLSFEELLAGLRTLGYSSPDRIQSATLEETGYLSAISLERKELATPHAIRS